MRIKHLITISLVTFLLTMLPAADALAQQSGGLWSDNTGEQLICRGDRDFGTFLSSLIGYDDFSEYWKDITGWPPYFYNSRYTTNYCQYLDIDNLLKRITKVRKQLRDAFYVCANTDKLKDTYYKLEAELYYLRNYVDNTGGTFLTVAPAQMLADMKNSFVINKGYFTAERFLPFFETLKTRYASRLEAYKNCKDPGWQNLVDKWNEFKDNVGGIGPAIKQASASISKRWARMANTPMKGGQSFFGGFLDARINGLTPKEGWDQIMEELKKNSPEGYTFDTLQAAKTVADQSYDEASSFAAYSANYQTLYGETSDSYVTQITFRLSFLNKIINQTFPFQNQTYQCVRRINNKQC